MKVVDLRDTARKINPKYTYAPQPMYVYHSTEELEYNEASYTIIKDIAGFLEFLKEENLINTGEYEDVTQYNVWLSTGETIIPDSFTEVGDIIYRLDTDNNIMRTDNCYIRLYVIHSYEKRYLLFTSSGVFKVSISSWELSAAVKPSFYSVAFKDGGNKKPYSAKIDRILNSRRTYVADIRAFNLFFNPLSECFLDEDETVKRAYGGDIKKADRSKIFRSEKMKNLISKELGVLMPELQKQIKEAIPANKVASWIKRVVEDTIENEKESPQNKFYAINQAVRAGYSDEISPIHYTREDSDQNIPILQGENSPDHQHLISNKRSNAPAEENKPTINGLYDDDDVKKKGDEKSLKELSPEDLEKERDNLGTIDGYVS